MLISYHLSFNILICVIFFIWPILESLDRNTEIFSLISWFKWKLQNLLLKLTDLYCHCNRSEVRCKKSALKPSTQIILFRRLKMFWKPFWRSILVFKTNINSLINLNLQIKELFRMMKWMFRWKFSDTTGV